MKFRKRLLVAAVAAVSIVLSGTAFAQGDSEYRFVMVSHIGSNDPNMQWLTLSMKEFNKKYPNVNTEYVSTNQYSLQNLIQLLEQSIATNPDGIAVPIVDAQAMEPILNKAMEKGIPVVAFNIEDARPEGEKIDYLTYVGGDEFKTGKMLGETAIAKAEAGVVPEPKKVVCAIHDAAHQGLKDRCRGMTEAMKAIDVEVESLFIGAEPAQARNTLGAYLSRNPDVNYAFATASFSAPWVYGVIDELGRSPDVDKEGMTILATDASPVSLIGIQEGRILATHSQGFWLQGYIPFEWLYWYHELGYEPQGDILTGPTIITADNVDHWAKLVRRVFGDAYDQQDTW